MADFAETLNETADKMSTENLDEIIKELDQWKNTSINIAIIGQSGVGKSTFINKFRGLIPR